jgi:probable rRNA maturation factor
VKLQLEVQRQIDDAGLPTDHLFTDWAEAALSRQQADAELVIRIVDEAESRQLNREYRGKDRPTNVLSFPFEAPAVVPSDLLGDLVICAQVVSSEAQQQGKIVTAHWAHMVVHGVLHLLGHDHQEEQEAIEMERLEAQILMGLGFDDPYLIEKEL